MSQPSPQFPPSRPVPPRPFASTPALRVGDAERQHACAVLSDHYAAGRLDFTEFTARQEAALHATTGIELGGLLRDLPPVAGPLGMPAPWAAATAQPPVAATDPSRPNAASPLLTLFRLLLGLGFVGTVLMSWVMVAGIASRYAGVMFVMFLGLCSLIALVGLRPPGSGRR